MAAATTAVTTTAVTTAATTATTPGSSTTSSTTSSSTATVPIEDNTTNEDTTTKDIKIVFSDLDGTLIHYPTTNHHPTTPSGGANGDEQITTTTTTTLLEFPPSSTGLKGVISAKTLSLVRSIRNTPETTPKNTANENTNQSSSNNNNNREQQQQPPKPTQPTVRFVLISGMRTTTLLQRLPYLPRADAYCSENGGRIFYPVVFEQQQQHESSSSSSSDDDRDVFWVRPKPFRTGNDGDGDEFYEPEPFGIVEDLEWKNRVMGGISSNNSTPSPSLAELAESPTIPLRDRCGRLWDFARDLVSTHGVVLDIKGYETCFRVNQKQQQQQQETTIDIDSLSALLEQPPWNESSSSSSSSSASKIVSSVNLKCVDFYLACSGKRNCCLYLARKFFPEEYDDRAVAAAGHEGPTTAHGTTTTDTPTPTTTRHYQQPPAAAAETAAMFLAEHAVCLCDDDNDLDMAKACSHAYLPAVSSATMGAAVLDAPERFSVAETPAIRGTDASDRALEWILARVRAVRWQQQQQH